MQIPSSTSSNLAALIAKYQAAAKSLAAGTATSTGSSTAAGSGGSNSTGADSATFSPESLQALQASTAQQMMMLQFGTNQDDSSSSSNGIDSLLAGFSSAGISGQLAALLAKQTDSTTTGSDGTAPAATAADLVKQAQQTLAQSTAMMFSDSSGQDGNATTNASDGLAALLTAYGQSITDAGNKAIKVAQDRITAAAAAATKTTPPGTSGTATA